MSKIVFVPLTDEMVFDRPEMITGPVTTYRPVGFKTSRQSTSVNKPFQLPGAYLKGDLVSGLDVVYVDDEPLRKLSAKKYRGLNRGIFIVACRQHRPRLNR